MKIARIIFVWFALISANRLSAQVASFTLPDFTTDQVVMKVVNTAIRSSYIALSDGVNPSYVIEIQNLPLNAKAEKQNDNLNTLAAVINKMSEKKYTILTVSAVGMGDFVFTTYIFKKE